MFQLFMLDQVDLDHIDSKQIPAFLRIDRDVKIQRMILRKWLKIIKGTISQSSWTISVSSRGWVWRKHRRHSSRSTWQSCTCWRQRIRQQSPASKFSRRITTSSSRKVNLLLRSNQRSTISPRLRRKCISRKRITWYDWMIWGTISILLRCK